MYVAANSINLGSFFQNLTTTVKQWGSWFIAFLGVCLIIAGVVQLVKAFISHGRGQVNWLIIGAMILVGGFLVAVGGNFGSMEKVSDIGIKTIEDAATGTGSGSGETGGT